MDTLYGSVYCYECKDHIYDDELEEILGIKTSNFFGKLELKWKICFILHILYVVEECFDLTMFYFRLLGPQYKGDTRTPYQSAEEECLQWTDHR